MERTLKKLVKQRIIPKRVLDERIAKFRNTHIDYEEKEEYIQELLPDVLEGRIQPGRVFDRVVGLDQVPDGYRAMNEREAIKVMVKP